MSDYPHSVIQPAPHMPCECASGHAQKPCQTCAYARRTDLQIEEARKRFRVADVQRAHDGVIEEHRQLGTDANLVHDPFILRVPVEVVSRIFQLCILPLTIDSPLDDFRGYMRMLLALSTVCTGWRRISVSSLGLWTTMCISLNRPSIDSGVLEELLGRSGQLPLSIYVRDDSRKTLEKSWVRQVVQMLSKHSGRLANLAVEIRGQYLPLFQDVVPTDSTPASIQALRLWCPIGDLPPNKIDMKNLKPSSLTLHGIPVSRLTVQWRNIVKVDIKAIHFRDCMKALEQTPLLQSCKFSTIIVTNPTDFRPPNAPVVLRHLKDLEFDFSSDNDEEIDQADMDNFLDALTLPTLDTLHLQMDTGRLPSANCLIALVQRSSCTLRVLKATSIGIDTDDFIRLLQRLPSLRELIIITFSNSLTRLLEALARPSASTLTSSNDPASRCPDILPNLTVFKYLTQYPDMVPWSLIPAIFGPISELRRGREWRPLRSFHLSIDQSYLVNTGGRLAADVNLFPLILAIRAVGIDLQIIDEKTGQDFLMPLMP